MQVWPNSLSQVFDHKDASGSDKHANFYNCKKLVDTKTMKFSLKALLLVKKLSKGCQIVKIHNYYLLNRERLHLWKSSIARQKSAFHQGNLGTMGQADVM